jgi:PadR family transcriptional regulator PadR
MLGSRIRMKFNAEKLPQTMRISSEYWRLGLWGTGTDRSVGATQGQFNPNNSPLAYRGEFMYLVSVIEESMSKPTDLVQGTLDLLLLKILALEPLNGFAVSQRLKQVSGDVLQVSDGSLYPALHKLEQEGWITAEWKASENNRRAKFYSLTRLGKKHLEKESANWSRLSGAISHVVKMKEA